MGENGGGGEIRTLGGLSSSLVFKTSAFNRSATPPDVAESYYTPCYSQPARLNPALAELKIGIENASRRRT